MLQANPVKLAHSTSLCVGETNTSHAIAEKEIFDDE